MAIRSVFFCGVCDDEQKLCGWVFKLRIKQKFMQNVANDARLLTFTTTSSASTGITLLHWGHWIIIDNAQSQRIAIVGMTMKAGMQQ